MKIRITFDFCEDERRAVAAQGYGRRPAASRETMTAWIEMTVMHTLQDICAEYDKQQAADVPQETEEPT